MSRSPWFLACVGVAILTPAVAVASLVTWDLSFTRRVDVTLCENGCAITLAGKDFALVINTGPVDITAAQFFSATFSVVSSRPEVELLPFINNPMVPIAPILPGEAVGSVIDSDDTDSGSNAILLDPLLPSEVHRNTAALQVISFQIVRVGTNAYEGPVRFDVEMTMADRIAFFTIDADVHLGEHYIAFTQAARVSSHDMSTPVASATWGSLKQRYR